MTGKRDRWKKGKRTLAFFCGAAFLTALLAGCGAKVVLTAGLKKNEVFRIGTASCTLPELMVYLTNLQNQYEAVYGSRIWEATDGSESLEQEARSQVLDQLAQLKVMTLLSKEKGVELQENETERAAAAAKEYFASLSETEAKALNVDEKELARMYGEYALADKVYREIVENINPEISDDEARTITVEAIRMEDADKAAQVAEKAGAEDADFEALAQENSEDVTVTYSFGKGEMSQAIEEAAFNLGKGEVSGVVQDGESFYVLKCISTFDEAQTQANKEKILEKRRSEAFNSEYDSFEKTLVRQLNEELWNSVTLIHNDEVKTSTFFEVYNMYFQTQG
ncbi:MAG: peptidyl-prolyl cis-trans isomerase [Eubacteriales bacterium]|nr:peptidyl-prolyl cis-trans isomerase [Eubacteriales bacterium]